MKKIIGNYDNLADKWIIQKVEPGMGEGARYQHLYRSEFLAKDPFSLKGPTKTKLNNKSKSNHKDGKGKAKPFHQNVRYL